MTYSERVSAIANSVFGEVSFMLCDIYMCVDQVFYLSKKRKTTSNPMLIGWTNAPKQNRMTKLLQKKKKNFLEKNCKKQKKTKGKTIKLSHPIRSLEEPQTRTRRQFQSKIRFFLSSL